MTFFDESFQFSIRNLFKALFSCRRARKKDEEIIILAANSPIPHGHDRSFCSRAGKQEKARLRSYLSAYKKPTMFRRQGFLQVKLDMFSFNFLGLFSSFLQVKLFTVVFVVMSF